MTALNLQDWQSLYIKLTRQASKLKLFSTKTVALFLVWFHCDEGSHLQDIIVVNVLLHSALLLAFPCLIVAKPTSSVPPARGKNIIYIIIKLNLAHNITVKL